MVRAVIIQTIKKIYLSSPVRGNSLISMRSQTEWIKSAIRIFQGNALKELVNQGKDSCVTEGRVY